MPETKIVHDQLLKDFNDLQLRVTQFSKVEQELINTRDRLDQELLMYRRLSEFNRLALEVNNEHDLIRLFAEAIVDIFESEGAIVSCKDHDLDGFNTLYIEGFSESESKCNDIPKALEDLNCIESQQNGLLINEEKFNLHSAFSAFSRGMYRTIIGPQSAYTLQLFALVSKEFGPIYTNFQERHLTIFEVFCQQVQAIFENRRNADIIQKQYSQIKSSEQELLKLSKIATQTANGVVITDSKGRIEWVNAAFTTITGYELEEILGKKPKEFLQGTATDTTILEILSQSLSNHETVEINLVNYRKNGDPYHNSLQITPVFNDKKELIHFIALQRDITREIEANNELIKVNNKLELITQKANIGIWELNTSNLLVTCNDVLLSQLGLTNSPAQLHYNDRLKTLIHPDYIYRLTKNFRNFAETGADFYEDEICIITPNEQAIKTLKVAIIAQRDPSSRITQLMGTTIDITTQRANEAQLQENLRLQLLLSETSLALNKSGTFDERIQHVLTLLGESTSVSRVYIFENSSDLSTCSNTYEWCNAGIVPQIQNLQNVPYDYIPYWRNELLDKGIIYAEHLSQLPEEVRELLAQQSIKSIIILPLFSQGEFTGFIGFDECNQHKSWSRGEIELLRAVSGMVANALEREHSEKSIAISEQKYRGIIEHMNLGLVETTKEGEITFMNRKFTELANSIDPRLLTIGENANEKLIQAEKSKKITSFRQLDNWVYEINYGLSAQTPISLMASCAPIQEDGQTNGFISIYLDISTVKELQRNLENAVEERDGFIHKVNSLKGFYENILNEAPYEIIVLDAELHPSFINRTARLHPILSNLQGSDKINKSTKDLLEPIVKKALLSKQLVLDEEKVLSTGGKIKHILRSVLPCYDELGELENVIITGTDISAIKQIEERLTLKNKELHKINTELDSFVYSVSHDLRAPLLSIKGVLSLVQKSGPFEDKTHLYLNHISQAVNKLDESIREILEYSRNARTDLNFTEINLQELVQSVYEDLMYIREKPVEFITNFKGQKLIITDKSRIHSVLKNILSNAFKYLRQDVHGLVTLTTELKQNTLYITVKDNGEGIEKKHIDKVFDMFYRASSRANGTGLGLYLCREIINKLNGTISIASEIGKGTTVKIALPVHHN